LTNITSEDIDGLPFLPALEKAAEKMWCGILRILNGTEQIGAVYMCDGNIAWAVSRNQTENFGSFLERIGMIPKEQHADIVNQYRSLGKSKNLGALLEEAGLISHSKLRECLMAHIRAAITSLMDVSQVVVSAEYGEMNVDSNLLFLTSEVLPRRSIADDKNKTISHDHSGHINVDPTTASTRHNAVLEKLATIPGYGYSFISGPEGKLLAFHKADDLNCNVEEAISSAISWINASKANAEGQHLEKMEFMLIEYEKGSLNVQWSDVNLNYFIAACFDKKGKLGVIKHKINELIPASRSFIAENINR
jgi:predicted regulator of Ras-like GTPase activity (Roadblock/LC7/MglB family)